MNDKSPTGSFDNEHNVQRAPSCDSAVETKVVSTDPPASSSLTVDSLSVDPALFHPDTLREEHMEQLRMEIQQANLEIQQAHRIIQQAELKIMQAEVKVKQNETQMQLIHKDIQKKRVGNTAKRIDIATK